MKGLKIIPLTFLIIALTYFGMWFVELNREEIVVHFGNDRQTGSTAIGFVIITSAFAGMVLAGTLCGIEIVGLSIRNRRMKGKLAQLHRAPSAPSESKPADVLAPRATGRFS